MFGKKREGEQREKTKLVNQPSLVVLAAARLRAELGAGVAVGDVVDFLEEVGLAVAAPGREGQFF